MISTEYVASECPFVVRRQVRWGECDPAGVVFTASFSDYVISVAELFYGALFGGTPQAVKHRHGFGTPTRALEFDFRRSLWPDDAIDVTVDVIDIRNRTFTLQMTARKADGDIAFVARLTPICIRRGVRESIDMPAVLRHALEQYRDRVAQAAAPSFAGESTS
ncbi:MULTISPECIES: acyl-CoA thioesterase [Pandoraea]|jgi:acyl-CoA thioesterase FadM|uniref:Thioesterase n=1 Tax=Pandoraea pnomenusa TaxID=93220 RepID=A0A378YFJ5_9BURK|nr:MULTISPECIES: acyl-CoA thioesterase [Pandoraea]AHB05299.1 thioesterase [Pandoraea pnomenusa 3kgm]AHB74337.1 thioesterase [Pandoraea pnomenusa]AHN73089.1 thioesterase [Pandoraea pnomenusa]AIU26134.1 thioesterase [Pandoraea pnomenusa]ANC43378.1 thioesterase [Pandoraea pnomenusa]